MDWPMLRKLALGTTLLAMSVTFSGCDYLATFECILFGKGCNNVLGEAATGPASSSDVSIAAKGKTIRYKVTMAGAIPDRGEATRNGAKTSIKGVALTGAFEGKVLSGGAGASELDLSRFTRGSWNTLINISGSSKTKKGGVKGNAFVRFVDPAAGQMCLRLKHKARVKHGKVRITGTFKSTGGTGDGARVVAKGSLKYKERPNGQFTATGKATYSEGSARPLPQACNKVKQKFGLP